MSISNKDKGIEYPSIPKEIEERLKGETGRIVSAIQDPVYVDLKKLYKIKAIVPPMKSRGLKLDDVVLVYDYLRGELFAANVIGHSTQTIDETKTTDKLYKIEEFSGYDYFTRENYDFLRTPHLFHLEPIIKVGFENGTMITKGSVGFAPSESASIFTPQGDEIKIIYGMKDDGMKIACLANENELRTFTSSELSQKHEDYQFAVPIQIPVELMNRHLSINGSTGSGKTVIIKNMISELHKSGASIFLTDTQGDFVAHLTKDQLSEDQKKVLKSDEESFNLIEKALDLDFEKVGINKRDVKIWYPPTISPNDDLLLYYLNHHGYQVRPIQLSSDLISNWATLATVLPKLSEVQYAGLSLIYSRYKEMIKDKGKRFILNDFIGWIEENETRAIEIGEIQAGSLRPIRRNLRILANKEILDRVPYENGTKYSNIFEDGKISILYLPRDLQDPEKDLTSVVPLLQLLIYQMILRNKAESSTQRVIIIDEAQNILPNEKYAKSKTIARELANQFVILAREGRKYNFSLLVASQEPSKINETVYSQCATRIFLRLSSSDISSIRGEIPAKYRDIMPRLKVGSGVIVAPDAIEVGDVWAKFPIPPIFHESIFKTRQEIEQSPLGAEFGENFILETVNVIEQQSPTVDDLLDEEDEDD